MTVLSLIVGALAAAGLVLGGLHALEPLDDQSLVRAILTIGLIPIAAGIPTVLVGRLHRQLTRAHLLAYFATLLSMFVIAAMFTTPLRVEF